MLKKSTQSPPIWRPVGLIFLVGAIVFLPFATRLGFYRDDWYMLWSAYTRGVGSIIDLFSIDRPFMGYTYALTYRLLGNSPLPWQLYSYLLKTLGAVAVYGIVRRLWPEQARAAAAAALLYLVYPGFLGQPNAATKTNQLLSLTAELYSIWLTALALEGRRKKARPVLIAAALVLGLLNFLLYEYMIGLEGLRLCLLWLIPQQETPLPLRDRLRRLVRDGWPYLALIIVFLTWRLAFFKSEREGADQFSLAQGAAGNLRGFLMYVGLESILDPLETVILAWGVPFEQYAVLEKPRQLLTALLIAGLATVLVLAGLWWENRLRRQDEEESGRARALSVCLMSLLALYGAMFPVLLAGRDVDFTGGFDKYTLHPSPLVAILLAGFIFGFLRGRARPILLGLLIFLGVATHVLNAYHWARLWENEKAIWWQLWWRAPGLQDGTILLASLPEDNFFEDYEMWGPANLIYRPTVQTVTLGAELLNADTVWEVWAGVVEARGMRKLEYVRDYNKSLLLALPGDSSCLKVVDREDILLPLRFEPRLIPILNFSHVEQIDLTAQRTTPPPAIFGPEPPHTWCFYYQSVAQASQAGDWETVVRLGDEALAAGARPVDRAEWLPFLEGYLWAGNEARVSQVKAEIAADAPLVKQVCAALAGKQFRFGDSIHQALTQALCAE